MDSFVEGVFIQHSRNLADTTWVDNSSDSHFIFSCQFGAIRLRKRNSYPQTFANITNGILQIGYGPENLGGTVLHSSLHELPEKIFYDNEFLLIKIDPVKQKIKVQRDAYCTVPLFVGTEKNKIVLSNHYDRTFQLLQLDSPSVNLYTVAQFLTNKFTFTNTLASNIRLLIDRNRFTWDKNYGVCEFAPDSSVATISQDRAGDPRLAGRMLEKTLDDYWMKYGGYSIGAELSCGVDTSLITGYYANKSYPLNLCTLIYPGDQGRTLVQKLAVYAQHFGLESHQIPIHPETDFPLSRIYHAKTNQPFHHHDDIYTEIFIKLADYFASQGIDTVFRGYGGDELCENITTYDQFGDNRAAFQEIISSFKHQPYITPQNTDLMPILESAEGNKDQTIPLTSVPHIRTTISTNNIYLDRGIWPVAPLADPRLYLYFQSLPIRYRYNKNILRAFHRARNFPPTLSDKSTNDDFENFFLLSVSKIMRPLLAEIMPTSVLAANGLLDADSLMDTLDYAESHLHSEDGGNALFNLFKIAYLEIILRNMGIDSLPLRVTETTLN